MALEWSNLMVTGIFGLESCPEFDKLKCIGNIGDGLNIPGRIFFSLSLGVNPVGLGVESG